MNNSIKLSVGIGLGIIIASALMFYSFMSGQYGIAEGSIGDGQAYISTTTDIGWSVATNGARVLMPAAGTLGSVVVTGTNAATLTLWDATTTDINKRTGKTATSSIVLAVIYPSATTNTYTFDTQFKNGLIASTTSIGGGSASSTITYKL